MGTRVAKLFLTPFHPIFLVCQVCLTSMDHEMPGGCKRSGNVAGSNTVNMNKVERICIILVMCVENSRIAIDSYPGIRALLAPHAFEVTYSGPLTNTRYHKQPCFRLSASLSAILCSVSRTSRAIVGQATATEYITNDSRVVLDTDTSVLGCNREFMPIIDRSDMHVYHDKCEGQIK